MPHTRSAINATQAWAATRVLVTGGTGFLGSHLVRRLVGLGARVAVLARPSASTARIADCADRVDISRVDLGDRAGVAAAVARHLPEVLIHLAAYGVHPAQTDLAAIVRTNVLGLSHLLEASSAIPYQRFINAGTCFEYGSRAGALSEDSPLTPLNAYAASKIMAWHLCQLHAQQTGKPIVTLRLFTFYGPGEHPDRLIPSTISSILAGREIRMTEGTQTRDYTYVEDIVEALLLAAMHPAAVGQTFNIGSGIDHSVRQVVERLRRLSGSRVAVRVGALPSRVQEARRLRCDPSKARALLGWRASTAFDDGLRRTLEGMRVTRGPAHRAPARSAHQRQLEATVA